ncbi:sigma-54 interaction domain-containing protein [Clostridium ganghwense]|uniref:Sigma 54-interacting transcriptional regulator n=1 Tax=Clostridium ganghwense TaxID=312089 RepID=A0ABT4CJD5_9CLOT|nr:sigma 54-interacting transcriptional regulator [Clostridium ganghwense]MCY6369160.1 sigma 54-interacting transcriptional regulator [Clostridium ganghwense]
MKKKVAVVTLSSAVATFYCKQLQELFGEHIIVQKYSLDNNSIKGTIDTDIVVISTDAIYGTVKKYIKDDCEIIITSITLSKKGFKKITEIPKGKKVMIVNLSLEMAVETISLIYQLGINDIEFIPVYPRIDEIPDLDIAITPGESRYVPKNVKQVIDIGHRVLDINTIIDIAAKLDLDDLLKKHKIQRYFKSIVTNRYGVEKLMGLTNRLESQFSILLQGLEEGIIGVDLEGIVYFYNESAESIIGLKKEEVLGKHVKELIPQLPFEQVLYKSKSIKQKLIKINGCAISVNVDPITTDKNLYGAAAIIKRFSDAEKEQHKLRSQLLGKGHIAKYSFEDIIGESEAINKVKDIAKRMAKSDSSILIRGETGTGKELFAQAIHNSSNRKDYQFVAVNCAALPESLLESELFGYEEGAFTGARKGGKLGLFELAHMGTLFLDEIGEMDLGLQARLLRVIQEREVMRIGGDRVINVDVRIIAATNRNLKELAKEGKFRQDLYFRLNVLPLNLTPLRERKEDILLLIEKIKEDLNKEFILSQSAQEAFFNHTWEGNVRELRNYVEYLAHLEKKYIDLGDIPFEPSKAIDSNNLNDMERNTVKIFKQHIQNKVDKYIFVLMELEKSYVNREPVGRRSIAKIAQLQGVFLSEQEIRRILIDLENYGMVEISKGRGGTKITQFGLKALKEIN